MHIKRPEQLDRREEVKDSEYFTELGNGTRNAWQNSTLKQLEVLKLIQIFWTGIRQKSLTLLYNQRVE